MTVAICSNDEPINDKLYSSRADWLIHVCSQPLGWQLFLRTGPSQVFLVVQLVHDEIGGIHGKLGLALELLRVSLIVLQLAYWRQVSQARVQFLNGRIDKKWLSEKHNKNTHSTNKNSVLNNESTRFTWNVRQKRILCRFVRACVNTRSIHTRVTLRRTKTVFYYWKYIRSSSQNE